MVNPNMLQENPPNLLDGKRMGLAGMVGTDDKLGFHSIDMGTFEFNNTVIARCNIHPRLYGNNGVPNHTRRKG